jgi:hypothetical protein
MQNGGHSFSFKFFHFLFPSKLAAIWLSMALLIVQMGCAIPPPNNRLPAPLSEHVRSRLGTIGIVSARFIPQSDFHTFAKGELRGAAKGVLGGSALGAYLGAGTALGGTGDSLVGLLLLPFLVIGGAALGGLVLGTAGAMAAVPKEKVREIEATINSALADLKIQETMRDRILKVASEQNQKLAIIEEQGPIAPDEGINYWSLANRGIDTVLEVSVLSVGFEGVGGPTVALAFSMTVRTKLIGVADGTVLYEHKLTYRSAEREFTDWVVNNAQRFRDEFDRSYQAVAEKIVEDLFLVYYSD